MILKTLLTVVGINHTNVNIKAMKRKLLYLIGVVCMMSSCVEEQNYIEVIPTPGKDVTFSATLGADAKTRTLYGEDATTAIKVNWVQGDTIAVYGVDCDRKQAVYSVSVDTDATPNGDGQNYATSLEKTGASGVQWGEDGVSDFYAVYPAADAQFNKTDGAISISTSISPTQNYVFNSAIDDDGVWRGTNFGADARTPSMQNAVMFAYTKDATSVYYNEDGTVYTDADGNTVAKPVDLHFKPFSTVLKFRFEGFTYDFGDAVTNNTVYVQSIIVTAPEGTKLAGDFDITSFDGSGSTATASASTEGKTTSNIVTINTMLPAGGYLPLQADEKVEFNVFVIPQEHSMAATSPWKVTINANVAGANQSYTYTLIPTDNQSYNITAGQIHKLKVPAYNIATPPTWDPSKWMTQIPTPVYLSELSIPGAWYCMDSGYQNTTDIATLYNAGIRAFNIDCRISKKGGTNDGWFGSTESKWADSDYTNGYGYLACAGTERATGTTDAQYVSDGVYVSKVIGDIITEAQKHLDEYVVIVFTFAEKPFTNSSTPFGTIRPEYITEQLNAILNTEGIKEFLYTDVTKDTTIDDVLKSGKNVIVKINHSNVNFATSTDPSFSMPEGHMASFASMATEGYVTSDATDIISGLSTSTSPYYGYYAKMQTYPIYNGKSATDLTYYFHQAQKTSSDQTRGVTTYSAVPTLGQRMDAIDDIISKSTEIYDASSHDAWFQLGIGGSIDGSYQAGVSDVLNEYLQGVIETKLTEDPSPVGIVLMNHATDADGNPIQLVKDIIEMNGKFYLKRKGGDITTGTDNSGGGDDGSMDEE